ncbi:hypothetical protein BDR05DRAFT_115262 [Suillus weaverae]|nr:hypothetical protein BDR05DRAFT_115262 [Suillus weaverae]
MPAHVPRSSVCVDADACTDTDARTHAHADAFLLLLLLTVSSSSLDVSLCGSYDLRIRVSLRRVVFTPTDLGITVHLGSLLHRSGPLSRPLPGVRPPKKLASACNRAYIFFLVIITYTTAQGRPQSPPHQDPITCIRDRCGLVIMVTLMVSLSLRLTASSKLLTNIPSRSASHGPAMRHVKLQKTSYSVHMS